jgi:hypothetical protein
MSKNKLNLKLPPGAIDAAAAAPPADASASE